MYKVIFISVVALILSYSCSASRRESIKISSEFNNDALETLQLAEKQNITNSSFFIERGRISTSGELGRINLLFTIKYKQPAIYLISLRSVTGTEAYRVLLTNDTVLINDRINKVTLYGKPNDFERISGFPAALLKVSVGDIFFRNNRIEIEKKCIDNKLYIDDYFQGLTVRSVIDCRIGKANSIVLTSGLPEEQISIFYSKFKQDNYKIPGKIEVNDFRRKVKIMIRIEKYSVPWPGEINFVPGSGYILRKLL